MGLPIGWMALPVFMILFLAIKNEPRPEAAVITALNESAGRIIVSEVFLTISNHTAEGKYLSNEVNAAQ